MAPAKIAAPNGLSNHLGWIGCDCPGGEPYRDLSSSQIRRVLQERAIFSVPPWSEFAGATIDDYNPTVRKQFEHALGTGLGLYIHGEPGVGKSRLAAVAMRRLFAAGLLVVPVEMPTLLGTIYESVRMAAAQRDDWRQPEEIVADLGRQQAVVIDDLGKEKLTEFVAGHWHALFTVRHGAHATKIGVTIITSNFSLAKLGELYERRPELADRGPAIVSRIAGMCWPLELQGDDRRLKGVQP